ncbi:MAG: SAM-dependent methyltransferase, partial [Cytophagales bacterium]|nr:SAM-dependent methyltransferase [Cytophaga sp.]
MVPIKELLSAETVAFIHKNRNTKIADLMLRMPSFTIDAKWVAAQIEGWQKAALKLPLWAHREGIVYPIRLSMEQCSSEKTAIYKSTIVQGANAVDLTGGFGVDTFFLAKSFSNITYIEQQEELAHIAAHNFKILGRENITVQTGNSDELLRSVDGPIDLIYLDPARRKDTQKVFRLSDCEPNAIALQDEYFSISHQILIKTSPMLDITEATRQLKGVAEIHIISIDHECKEVLYLLKKGSIEEPLFVCMHDYKNKQERFTFHLSEENQYKAPLSEPLTYLYEPNSSILKAGAFNSITKGYPVFKLNTSTHLYTSSELVEEFPGRIFTIETIAGYDKKELLKLLPDGKANIQTRNFPDSVEAIRKKTGLKDGGSAYLFAVTLLNNKKNI